MAEEAKKSDCVKVAIRCRPPSRKEIDAGEKSIVELTAQPLGQSSESGSVIINDPNGVDAPTEFAFDIVFDMQTEQLVVFEALGKQAILQTFSGFNGTIFAYGQTGSGKSWSMSGAAGELRGIIPRMNEELFSHIEKLMEECSTSRFLVTCSFFEIYNEIIFDLLNPPPDRSKVGAGLQVKEHPVLGIYVKDLQEQVATCGEVLEKLVTSGNKNRAVSSTLMNSGSSRSHSIFTIKVHQKDEEDKGKNSFAKLNLVDLAGSERQKGTGASGQTLKEGANINKSLSALGNVINALVDTANGKKVFIPYRNSKLTRVLQESLGGNSLCTMLAALSPAACNYEETLSTMRYANRAKAIKVSATKNDESSQISRLNAEIAELKKKLGPGGGGGDGGGSGLMAEEERAEIKAKFEAQLADMQAMVSNTWEDKKKISEQHESQLNAALEEQRRQAKALEQEAHKRFRLLQEQNDLELSIRGLLDTIQMLPPGESSKPLRSGDLPQLWLKQNAAIAKIDENLKQHHTMALVFMAAFGEDLRLWVDGEEASDIAMARTGARRSLVKLQNLQRECNSLNDLETQAHTKARELSAALAESCKNWEDGGSAAILDELRKTKESDEAEHEPSAEPAEADPPEQTRESQAIEDTGRILKLIEQQAGGRSTLAGMALEMSSTAELVLKGIAICPSAVQDGADPEVLKSVLPMQEEAAQEEAPEVVVQRKPREERPLHEWVPEDADDTVEGTEYALKLLIDLECLNKKKTPQDLLARPPPKFVHDVAILVKHTTGFLEDMPDDWPDGRDEKVELLQYIADTVARAVGLETIAFDPASVLKGKEVPQTLRLLQLMGIAGAWRANPGAAPTAASAQGAQKKGGEDKTPAKELPRILEAVSRCVQGALSMHEKNSAQADNNGRSSPTRELEQNVKILQERVEEDLQLRQRRETKLAELQKDLEVAKSVLNERTAELDAIRESAEDKEKKKAQQRKQVEELRAGLMARAEQMVGNEDVDRLRQDLAAISTKLTEKVEQKLSVANDVKVAAQSKLEMETQKDNMEMEVKRMKLRLAEGLNNVSVQNQDEEVMVLAAEKQKLDVRVQTLEEKMKAIVDSDDVERQRELGVAEENKAVASSNDELQQQLQVVTEERDGIREGMEILYAEKTRAQEELENVSDGYTNLSDRLLDKQDESREIEEEIEKLENLLKMLRENFERNRQSPQNAEPPAAADQEVEAAAVAPPADEAPAKVANGFAASTEGLPPAVAADDASSHYSDDDFEDPEDD